MSGSIFKLKVKATRGLTYAEVKTKTYTEIKNFKYGDIADVPYDGTAIL